MKNSNPNEVNQTSVGASNTQYFQTDDNPHFQGDVISTPFNRDIKIKLIFIMVIIIFLIDLKNNVLNKIQLQLKKL